jgi:hypothetical protein
MKTSTVLRVLQRSTDVIDGPGWTDVDVNGYYDNDGKYVPPQSNNQ